MKKPVKSRKIIQLRHPNLPAPSRSVITRIYRRLTQTADLSYNYLIKLLTFIIVNYNNVEIDFLLKRITTNLHSLFIYISGKVFQLITVDVN